MAAARFAHDIRPLSPPRSSGRPTEPAIRPIGDFPARFALHDADNLARAPTSMVQKPPVESRGTSASAGRFAGSRADRGTSWNTGLPGRLRAAGTTLPIGPAASVLAHAIPPPIPTHTALRP